MWRPPERIRYEATLGRMPSRAEAAAARLFRPVRSARSSSSSAPGCRRWCRGARPTTASSPHEVLDWYERFADGQPGAIVVEATGIRDVPSGPLLRIGHDRFLPGLAQLVDAVRTRQRRAARGSSSRSSTSSPSAGGPSRRSSSRASWTLDRSRTAHALRAMPAARRGASATRLPRARATTSSLRGADRARARGAASSATASA